MIKRTLKDWLSELQKQTGPGRKRRSQMNLPTVEQVEACEQRLLLSATGSFGNEAELTINNGDSNIETGERDGRTLRAFAVSLDEARSVGGLNGTPKKTRIVIGENVGLLSDDPTLEILRVTGLGSGRVGEWYRADLNNSLIGRESAGSNGQIGRAFRMDEYGTTQVTLVVFKNGSSTSADNVLHTFEFRRLLTSDLTATAQTSTARANEGQNFTAQLTVRNIGNQRYQPAGVATYDVVNQTGQVVHSNGVSLPSINAGGSTILTSNPISLSAAGSYQIRWAIDTGEGCDWGPGSGASVLERDSFANQNFGTVENNRGPFSTPVIIDRVPDPKPPVITVDPYSANVSEGGVRIVTGSVFDTDSTAIPILSGLTGLTQNGNRWSYTFDAIDGNSSSTVNLTATDSDQLRATRSLPFNIVNVEPTLSLTTNSPLEEGGTAILNGTYFDPGVLDTHTVTIDWGDGTVQANLAVSGGAFSFNHQYTDDNAADRYDATVTIVDKDGGATTQTIPIVVTNVAPIVDVEITSNLDENGVAILTGSILDPGTDSFNATIDWGDGTSTVLPLAAGTTEFTTTHQYLDDGPSPGNGTSSDDYAVVVTVTDDDGDSGSANAVTTVNNVAPVIRGTPAFSAPQFIVTGTNDILGFDVADIDGDGDLDLASASRLDNRVAWYPNDGNGNFSQINLQPFDDTIVPRLADFDADGDIDLIASAVDGRSIRLYENDGNQNFTARTILANVRANQLRVADLNGDSTLDIAYGSQDGQLGVLINSGTATFTNQPLMSQLGVVRDIHIDDVDQDGLADIMVAARATSSNSASNLLLLTNTGNFSFQTTTLRSDSGVVFAGVNTLDVDNDGDTDIVGTDETNDAVYLYNNTGGVFAESQLPPTVDGPNFATPSDVDGDGDIDLLVSGVLDDSVSFLRNDGTGTFEEFSAATGIDGARNITVADIDGDGSQEILVDSRFGDGIVAFEYLGEQLPALSAINEGQAATLTVEYFDVGTLDAHKVTVDWGDGNVDTDVPVSNGTINATHVYADDGPTDFYQILVTLTDDDLGVSTAATTINVANVAPTASIEVSEPRVEGTEIVVTGSATDPGVNDIHTFSYEVLKNGQSYATGEGIDLTEFRFTPDDDGTYEIILTVADNDGGIGTASTIIEVSNVGPVIDLGEDCLIHEGDSVSLDLTRITDPGNDTINSVTVDWGDGSVETFDTLETVSHVYVDGPAEFTIKVTLVDEDGTWTAANDSLAGYQTTLSSLAANTIARYQLEGDASDSAGTANGVLVGAPTFEAGPVGSAISVENGRYAHVLPPDGFVPGNNTFSTSLHFRMDSIYAPLNFAPLLVMQQDDFREGANFAVGTTNERGDTLLVQFDGGGDRQLLSYVAPESLLGSWHQAGYSVDRENGVLTLVLDGQIVDQQVLTVSSLDSTKGVYIGQYDFSFARNGVPRFIGGEGAIDDVLIFDSALSEAQYESLSLAGNQPFEKIVTVENVAPTPSIDLISEPRVEATEIVVTTSATDPALDNDTLTFTYEILKDGVFFTSGGGIDADEFRFTPDDNGEYTVSLTVADEDGGQNTVSEVISVTNLDPTANEDAFTVSEDDGLVALDVLTNDTDPAGAFDPLQVTSINTMGTIGEATLTATGVDYSPNGQFEFLAVGETATDTFTYTIDDGDGGTSTATVTITVTGENDAPTANPDFASTTENASVTTDVIANDADPDVTDILSLVGGSSIASMTLDIDGSTIPLGDASLSQSGNEITFDPGTDFDFLATGETATVTVDYTVSDDAASPLTDDGTLTITVVGTNDAPVANDIVGQVNEDGPAVVVAADFTDADVTDTHAFDIDTSATAGSVINNGDGTFSYAPNGQFESLAVGETATDSFLWTVTDNNGASSQAIAVITVVGSNDAPQVTVESSNPTVENKSDNGWVTVTGTFTDLDISDEHDVVIDWGDGTTSSATVDQLGDTFSGMHDYTDGGIYEITVTIDDGNGGIDTQTTQAVVTGTGLVDGVLYIIGSDSKDSVRVRTYHHRIKVQTSIGHRRHEYNLYSVADVQKVVVITCGANDHIDVLTPSHIPVHVDAGDGRDHIWTANGKDYIDGGKGKDKIWSYGGDDTIFAGAGDDHVWSGSGNDVIDAGAGRDNVFASYGNDIIYGREGMDDINAGDGDDIVFGGSGADWLSGDDGNDCIDGGSGNDMIKGGRGHDVLVGGTGRDQIFAGHGNDLLIGGSLSIDWESQDDLSDVDEAMMAWAAGDLTQTLDLLGNVEDDNTPDKLFGERGYDTILHGRRDWWRY